MVGDIKNIIVIQSLAGNEKQTGTELYEETIEKHIKYKQKDGEKMTHKFHDIADKNSFIDILKFYVENSKYMDGGLVIHLEMHGAENQEGLILADGSLITWEEIVDLLREININTKDNLYITMATCYGRMMYDGVSREKKSPYSGYISASKEVTVAEVMDDFSIIFEALIEKRNLVESYFELEAKGSKKFFYMDSKRTFEENFKVFKNNPENKLEILNSVTQTVKDKYTDFDVDPNIADAIYESALKTIYESQKKSFEF